MQFTAILFALAAALSVSAATVTRAPGIPDGCDFIGCAEALAPGIESCAEAVAAYGLDPGADASCLEDAASDYETTPAACTGCF